MRAGFWLTTSAETADVRQVVKSAQAAQTRRPRVVSEAAEGWGPLELGELWRFREVVAFLALRDVQIRYKQSLLGAAWVVLQPLLTMVVFTVLFGLLLGRDRMPTVEGVPYAISTYCALVPWTLFATALTASSNSLVQNQNLITKVYFPRLAIPLSPAIAALVDFAAAFAVLLAMMLFCGIAPGPGLLAVPLFALLAIASALALSLWLSALNAMYHDVRHVLPFIVQLGMFATPVVYTSAHLVGGRAAWIQWLYGLNPMAGVVEGFRWALLGGELPSLVTLALSCGIVAALLWGGLRFFRRMERRFADWV
jgi:lipopolysaccharide transport system permease protein